MLRASGQLDRAAVTPRVVSSSADLDESLACARREGQSIGLVPTMGALHAGHLSLVKAARKECDVVVATIFVNPTQFGPNEDFGRYPRTLDADLKMLAGENTDIVFVPSETEMYPEGYSTAIDPPAVAAPFEGHYRPGHFRGVATVVLKLFNLVRPAIAFFGQKDYQQSQVIRRMVTDLNLPVGIRVCPTVRESDGLAMSSRNKYLDPAGRQRAAALFRSLEKARHQIANGERASAAVRALMQRELAEAGISRIDYAAVADANSLIELDMITRPAVLLIAAFVGGTRLIDNMLVE